MQQNYRLKVFLYYLQGSILIFRDYIYPKAGTASKQRQIGERDKTIVLDEKNLSISNTKIRQEQKAKNEASQIQIGRIKDNE